jgi:hypothetical protein
MPPAIALGSQLERDEEKRMRFSVRFALVTMRSGAPQ